ncbi:hypothetical protein [Candidatus Magnetomonas plexicatena]|uniref:hypothetical protein n=1 Tax=Candidatus Magnetomonas plexicatena TaxID=2552947 RepID=UPI001C744818|nr:hypothetical protein E2O03_014555 [Nitrospirales bacterium LBB_01]
MNAKETVVVKGSVPFDMLDEDEQIMSVIMALRQHGKIDLPMNDNFERAVRQVREETASITMPYYTK